MALSIARSSKLINLALYFHVQLFYQQRFSFHLKNKIDIQKQSSHTFADDLYSSKCFHTHFQNSTNKFNDGLKNFVKAIFFVRWQQLIIRKYNASRQKKHNLIHACKKLKIAMLSNWLVEKNEVPLTFQYLSCKLKIPEAWQRLIQKKDQIKQVKSKLYGQVHNFCLKTCSYKKCFQTLNNCNAQKRQSSNNFIFHRVTQPKSDQNKAKQKIQIKQQMLNNKNTCNYKQQFSHLRLRIFLRQINSNFVLISSSIEQQYAIVPTNIINFSMDCLIDADSIMIIHSQQQLQINLWLQQQQYLYVKNYKTIQKFIPLSNQL